MDKKPTRTALLQHLKAAEGTWVSGQELSRRLFISRAAVSKNIQKLRREGYRIEAVTNKGYHLTALPDRLLKCEIQQGLKTRVFGRGEIYHFDTVGSTNNRAKALADTGASEGTLVLSESQTAGRGRRGRTWISPENDGIYLSMIARPKISPALAPQITLLAAAALADTIIDQTDLAVEIKWPNDILTAGRKLAGILTELQTEMDLVNYVVIGIGLNVNTGADDLGRVMDRKATSIALETGTKVSRLALLKAFLEAFETRYDLLVIQKFKPVLDRWKSLAGIMGRWVSVDVAGEIVSGRVVDVESTGVLVLEDQAGKIRRIFSGDLKGTGKK